MISGEDGNRYTFKGTEWKADIAGARPGVVVDFVFTEPGNADQVFPISTATSTSKSKVTAGVLAILLGAIGAHKFYLGYTNAGLIMAGIWLAGFLTTIVGIGFLILCALALVALIEGITYLTKSDAEFEAAYVTQTRPWF